MISDNDFFKDAVNIVIEIFLGDGDLVIEGI